MWPERIAPAGGRLSGFSDLFWRRTSVPTEPVSFPAFWQLTGSCTVRLAAFPSLCPATKALPCTPAHPPRLTGRAIALTLLKVVTGVYIMTLRLGESNYVHIFPLKLKKTFPVHNDVSLVKLLQSECAEFSYTLSPGFPKWQQPTHPHCSYRKQDMNTGKILTSLRILLKSSEPSHWWLSIILTCSSSCGACYTMIFYFCRSFHV